MAGLGEKKVVVTDIDCSTSEFHEHLFQAFPKLKDCGGFECLRCIPSTRDLEVIPSPACHTPKLLRNRIGSGRVYIRPIQMDLDIEPEDEFDVTNQVSNWST